MRLCLWSPRGRDQKHDLPHCLPPRAGLNSVRHTVPHRDNRRLQTLPPPGCETHRGMLHRRHLSLSHCEPGAFHRRHVRRQRSRWGNRVRSGQGITGTIPGRHRPQPGSGEKISPADPPDAEGGGIQETGSGCLHGEFRGASHRPPLPCLGARAHHRRTREDEDGGPGQLFRRPQTEGTL